MIDALYIRDLVLVPELNLEFQSGFTTVTGETGAGKSLILGALQLLSGGRASANVIRKGARSCQVSADISIETEKSPGVFREVQSYLEEHGIPLCEEGHLMLRRVISESGSRATVNAVPVPVSVLRDIGERLIAIHGPHDNQAMLQPSMQLRMLDLFGNHGKLLKKSADIWHRLNDCRQQLSELKKVDLSPEEVELFAHQLREITNADLRADEEDELLARHRLVANAARLKEISGALASALSQSENSVVDTLAPLIRTAEEMADMDDKDGGDFLGRLTGISEQLSELSADLYDYGSKLELDDEELQAMESRIALIQKLKRRFGPTIEDVLATADRLNSRLEQSADREDMLKELREREQKLVEEHRQLCISLHDARSRSAERLSAAITEKLQHLGFAKAVFEVRLSEGRPGVTGCDNCEYFFSPNCGEDIAPLRASASSGEAARVMLAVKAVLSDVDEVPILIFDEIDANIGGRTAAAVAAELRSLGERHQVFVITHLPLIAAAGNHHFVVEKRVVDDRTVTTMALLEESNRTAEIVRMLGAAADDKIAIAHAQEMLKA